MNSHPHMCRDGHPEVGYREEQQEMCPVCFAVASLEAQIRGRLDEVAALLRKRHPEAYQNYVDYDSTVNVSKAYAVEILDLLLSPKDGE